MPSLDQFFQSPAAITVSGRPVSFRAIRSVPDPNDESRVVTRAVEVSALFRFVNESERAAANKAADLYVNSTLKPGESAPDGAREDARALHTLFYALLDSAPPHGPLCRTVDELRGALTRPAFLDLWAEYGRFESEEFPPYVDPVDFGRLVELARKKPLSELGQDFDSDFVKRCLVGLGNLLVKSATRK